MIRKIRGKITKNRNMVRSDALPTELRRTCLHVELNFKVIFFWCPKQRSSLEPCVIP